MIENAEKDLVKFIMNHQDLTIEEIKKIIKSSYPNDKIYNEDIERLIIVANAKIREDKKLKNEGYER